MDSSPSAYGKLKSLLKSSSKKRKLERASLSVSKAVSKKQRPSTRSTPSQQSRAGDPERDSDGHIESDDDADDRADEYGEDHEGDEDEDEDEDEDDDALDSESDDDDNHEDFYNVHFSDGNTQDLDYRIAAVENNALQLDHFEDDTFENIIVYSPENSGQAVKKPDSHAKLVDYKVKSKLVDSWPKLSAGSDQAEGRMTPLQSKFFHFFNQYADVYHPDYKLSQWDQIRSIYCLHAMNHVFKTRDRVLKNNQKLKAHPDQEIRDQGYTRPKVLILVPFKNDALDIVKKLIVLSGTSQQENKKRFFDQFKIDDTNDVIDPRKPEDYRRIFEGNIDDCFRVGIKFTRKNMKLFSNFYASDVIIASPLGLRLIIGSKGDKKRDYDYLSSIEVVVVDKADTILMQNWDHVEHIFNHLNLTPTEAHGCDFSRVRSWYLDGRAKNLRQTIVLSEYATPELNALFNRRMKNVFLKTRTKSLFAGSISDVVVQVPQLFHRINSRSLKEEDDTRFTYFVEKVLPTLRQSAVSQKHTLIFVPSFVDFVRVRNYFSEKEENFELLSEYSSGSDIARARSGLYHGKLDFVLCSERFHFFKRYNLRGVRHLVFYGLPDHPGYYPELMNMMHKAPDNTCTVLYSKYDKLKLERIVGSKRVDRMCEGEKDGFMFT